MALLPDLHVNLDRPTIQHIYQLFLPIVPGGTLVVGLLLARPNYLRQLGAASGVGYYLLLATTVFVAYAAGLMLYTLSVHFGMIASMCAINISGRNPKFRPLRNNMSISQNHVWRTVAAEFLGKELAPTIPALLNSSLFTNGTQFPQPAPPNVMQYDLDWNDWYNILQDYVLRCAPSLAPDVYFLYTIVQATGWAVIIASLQARVVRGHRVDFTLVALLVIATALVQFGANYTYHKFDRLKATDLTARLLTEIRARQDALRSLSGPTTNSP